MLPGAKEEKTPFTTAQANTWRLALTLNLHVKAVKTGTLIKMLERGAPPDYSQDGIQNDTLDSQELTPLLPQILILPPAGSQDFQKGFIGVEGEHATIEGEIQMKAETGLWAKVTVTISTSEKSFCQSIELFKSQIQLWNHTPSSPSLPSALTFCIPVTSDMPQCIHTPQTYLEHNLIVELHPVDATQPIISKSTALHVRRFTPHYDLINSTPVTQTIEVPTPVNVEISRTVFHVGENIPIYVQIPTPDKDLVLERGIRLRNVKMELLRNITLQKHESDPNGHSQPSRGDETTQTPAYMAGTDLADSNQLQPNSRPNVIDQTINTVLARSGAVCRFHSSRTVRLRCVLRPPLNQLVASHLDHGRSGTSNNASEGDGTGYCASITQETILHSVKFQVRVLVTFMDMLAHTEHTSSLIFPISIIPSPAPLPEVEENLTNSYQKKHDRPPARTNRYEDLESSAAPHYQEGMAGPSAFQSAAPPPFDEPDAPPPFFSVRRGPSTSSQLPTFIESERQVYLSEQNEVPSSDSAELVIDGEGVSFGFAPSAQFDGHPEDTQGSTTPPPTLEMATMDVDVTNLASSTDLSGIASRMEPPGESNTPLHPPAMDDPLDPPPSIDSDYRAPVSSETLPLHTITLGSPFLRTEDMGVPLPLQPQAEADSSEVQSNEPPPYLIPSHGTQTPRPPPYTDDTYSN